MNDDLFYIIFPVFFSIFFIFVFSITIANLVKVAKSTQNNKTRKNNQYFQNFNNRLQQTKMTANNNHSESHDKFYGYSANYSKAVKDSGTIVDKPLSEAEKNVLYGK